MAKFMEMKTNKGLMLINHDHIVDVQLIEATNTVMVAITRAPFGDPSSATITDTRGNALQGSIAFSPTSFECWAFPTQHDALKEYRRIKDELTGALQKALWPHG